MKKEKKKKNKKKEKETNIDKFVDARVKFSAKKGMELKCMEAYTRDVGRGVVRIDYDTMDIMDISTGDFVEVKSRKRKVIGKALPLYPSDEKNEIFRIDGVMRKNLNILIGSRAWIKKTKAVVAEEIDVAYVDKQYKKLTIDGRYLADALENNGLMIGQTALFPYFGGRVEVKVMRTKPEGNVIVTQKTKFEIVELEEVTLINTPTTIMDEACPFCKNKIGKHTPSDEKCRDLAELWFLILRIAVKN